MEVWYFICTKVCVNFYPMGSGASCASQVSYCAPLAPKYTHIHSSTSTFFWLANQAERSQFLRICPGVHIFRLNKSFEFKKVWNTIDVYQKA